MADMDNGRTHEQREKARLYRAKYRLAHPGQELVKRRARHLTDPDTRKAYQRSYYVAHRDEILARTGAYKDVNRDHITEHMRQYNIVHRASNRDATLSRRRTIYASDIEQRRAYAKEWRAANLEKERARGAASKRAHYAANRVELLARHQRWVRENPDKQAAVRNRRRARQAGAIGSHTAQEWRQKVSAHNGCCFYCEQRRPLTQDHDIPLSRGGSDDIENILPACKPCNSRKRDKTSSEFMAWLAAK